MLRSGLVGNDRLIRTAHWHHICAIYLLVVLEVLLSLANCVLLHEGHATGWCAGLGMPGQLLLNYWILSLVHRLSRLVQS